MNELFIRQIAEDCAILLRRALDGKSIACFGVDGFGQHGTTDQAQTYDISAFIIKMDLDEDDAIPSAHVLIELEGYDALKFGHILSDQNFKFSLNKLLEAVDIRADCWTWGALEAQEQDAVVLNVEVPKLLEWY